MSCCHRPMRARHFGFIESVRGVRLAIALGALCLTLVPAAVGDELELLEERAFKLAVARIEPSLVQIETIGGLDRLAGGLDAAAATTGIVVSSDGEILTSAFAFASRPSSILVRLADGRRLPARQVATDHVLQLTLLRVDVKELRPPAAVAPRREMRVGQWSLAVGRTLDLKMPSVSVGIVSALNRVWGKAIQTDAKVSPVNYGGALVDIRGRVMGILVPLSPQSPELMAGVEWYDSGIGFAVPFEAALRSAERLRSGKDLKRGLLGIRFPGRAIYGQAPVIDEVRYGSPAEKAGLRKNDRIVSVEGQPMARVAQVRQVLETRYAGDSLRLVVDRDGETATYQLELVDELPPWEAGFLGLLPRRSGDDAGVRVRFVVPGSPAAAAGLAAGDLLQTVQGQPVQSKAEAAAEIQRIRPGEQVELTFLHGDKQNSATAELTSVPTEVLSSLPPPEPVESTRKPGVKVGRLTETFETHQHDFLAYVPPNYDPTMPYGLLVWLHPAGDPMDAGILKRWRAHCETRGVILLAPRAASPQGWNPTELPFVRDVIDLMRQRYSIDDERVVVHGVGDSAGFALSVAFTHRDRVRGAIVVDGALAQRPPENRPEYPLQLLFAGNEQGRGFRRVRATVDGLRKMKYPVVFVPTTQKGAGYPAEETVGQFARWLDSLDAF